MDGTHFDAWTRRRFGLALSGVTVTAIGFALPEPGKAGRSRKRCKKLTQGCEKGNRNRKCCNGLTCGENEGEPETHCCRKGPAACDNNRACCSPARCDIEAGHCCHIPPNGPCDVDDDCCGIFVCGPGRLCRNPPPD